MNEHKHNSGRPNFLRRGPGLLDFLYNSWCSASSAFHDLRSGKHDFGQAFKLSSESAAIPKITLPPHVIFMDENIICIPSHQKRFLIEPFCQKNNIVIPPSLYISVARQDCIGLKRDVLEKLLKHASDVFAHHGDVEKANSARDILSAFDFSYTPQGTKTAISYKPAPYKMQAPWE